MITEKSKYLGSICVAIVVGIFVQHMGMNIYLRILVTLLTIIALLNLIPSAED